MQTAFARRNFSGFPLARESGKKEAPFTWTAERFRGDDKL
jgi:hypothetical protein